MMIRHILFVIIVANFFSFAYSACSCITTTNDKKALFCQYTIIESASDYVECSGVDRITLINIFDNDFGSRDFYTIFPSIQSVKFRFEKPMCAIYCQNSPSLPEFISIDDNCNCVSNRVKVSSSPPDTTFDRDVSPPVIQLSIPSTDNRKYHRHNFHSTKPSFDIADSLISNSPPITTTSAMPATHDHNDIIREVLIYVGSILSMVIAVSLLLLLRRKLSSQFPRLVRFLDAFIACIFHQSLASENQHDVERRAAILSQALQLAETNFRSEVSSHSNTNRELTLLKRENQLLQTELDQIASDAFFKSTLEASQDTSPKTIQVQTSIATATNVATTTTETDSASSSISTTTAGGSSNAAPITALNPVLIEMSLLEIERALHHLMDEKTRIKARSMVIVHLLQKDFRYDQLHSSNDGYLITKFRLHYAPDLLPGEYGALSKSFSLTRKDLEELVEIKERYIASRK